MAGRGAVTAFADHCEWTGASADNRENWLISRRQGIGGSDVAAIVGLSRYDSALSLYLDKIGEALPDTALEEAVWGRIFEPAILKEYAGRTGRRVVRGGKLMRNRRAPHHMTTLDGVQLTRPPEGCRGPGVAEVKTTGFTDRFEQAEQDAREESLPLDVRVQLQWELSVTGATWGTCIWLPFPERKLHWIDVRANPAVQSWLIDKVDEFWTMVLERRPPLPDGSEASSLALRQIYPTESNETIAIPGPRVVALAQEYERCRAAEKMMGERASFIKNLFKATMAESKYAVLEDGRYWSSSFYAARENKCKHCQGVLSAQASYRTYTFREPRAKPFVQIAAVRELVGIEAEVTNDALLDKQLAASLAANDAAAMADEGAAE